MNKLPILLMLLGALASAQAPDPKQGKQPAPQLTVDQILDNFIAAIGGRERILQIKTMVKKGVTETENDRITFVRYRRAPDTFTVVNTNAKGTNTTHGYDGRALWGVPAKPVENKPETSQCCLIDDRVYKELPIVSEFFIVPYKKAKLRGVKKVNDRPAYVVELNQEDGARSTYYLDTESFLLLRADFATRVLAILAGLGVTGGSVTVQYPDERVLVTSVVYYSDWRDVAGFKLPFEVRRKTSITKILEYKIDTDIDPAIFVPFPESIKIPLTKKPGSK